MGLELKAKKIIKELRTLKSNDEEKALIMSGEFARQQIRDFRSQQIRERIQSEQPSNKFKDFLFYLTKFFKSK